MGKRKTTPSYYTVIPSHVLFIETLSDSEKLLYGHIVNLSNIKGYCWSNNSYFAEIFGVGNRSIQNWIANLEKHGLIRRDFYGNKKKKNQERRIWITKK